MPSEPVAGPFWRPKNPLAEGRQALIPLPSSGLAECSYADPLGECRRDANTLAPNGPKARTLRCARQELVRVPESNTKYGGLWGITGGKPSPVVEPSIGESSGIPNRKKLHPGTVRTLHPAVHRAGIFLGNGDCASRTHVGVRKLRAGMSAAVVVGGANPRQAELDLAGLPTCLIRPDRCCGRASPRPA